MLEGLVRVEQDDEGEMSGQWRHLDNLFAWPDLPATVLQVHHHFFLFTSASTPCQDYSCLLPRLKGAVTAAQPGQHSLQLSGGP